MASVSYGPGDVAEGHVDGDLAAVRSALPSYELGEVLGRGAWGTVVGGHHRGLNRPVAIKWLRPELVDDTEARRRFNAEAQVLAALDHPHIVRVYDYVETGSVCALVMERLPGGTMADRTRVGALSPQSACAYAIAALHGLEHAHHHDVLHRDVKPENLMLAGDGRLRVTDFGIATIIGANAERLTATGVALGTPAYMAPEQFTDPDRIGAHTDVWSTAAVLYELLAHQLPYDGRPTLHAALLARATADPRPLRDVAPDVPTALSDAVMQGLAREVEQRFPSCLDAATAIEEAATDAWGPQWLAGTGIPLQRTAHRQIAAATGVVPLTTPRPAPSGTPAAAGRRRPRARIWMPAAAVVVAAGVVAGILLGGGGHPAKGSSPAAPGSGSLLPAVPTGWGGHLAAGVGVPSDTPMSEYGAGALEAYTFTGDPASGADFRSQGTTDPAATVVRDIEGSGAVPYLATYTLRTTGHPGDDQSGKGVLAILRSHRLMTAYWQSTAELLKELGSLNQPLFLVVDPSVAANVQSAAGNDPRAVPAVVASSGLPGLAGLPNTFAGWAQGWIHLRDTLAPDVKLGWSVDSYGVGNFLIPNRPSDAELADYEQALREFYGRLAVSYDFIDYTAGYGDGARTGPQNMARAGDMIILAHWVADMVAATHVRVVLDSIPVGNTLMRAEDNKPYHWQDRWAQLLLGANRQDRANLTSLRNAGVMGLVFGAGYTAPYLTCACDGAGDGITNPPVHGTARRLSLSADDDGGYLAQRLAAYAAGGRLPL